MSIAFYINILSRFPLENPIFSQIEAFIGRIDSHSLIAICKLSSGLNLLLKTNSKFSSLKSGTSIIWGAFSLIISGYTVLICVNDFIELLVTFGTFLF